MISEELVAEILLDLAVIILIAKVFEEIISYFGYPPVLGDILAGILLGPTVLNFLNAETIEYLDVLKWLGIISLLFLAGMETKFSEFVKSIKSSLYVAIGGIIFSYILGYFAGLMVGLTPNQSMFLGAILTATSVGLTVKTLTDIGALGTRIFSTILGAAVLDDVGGLIVLGITTAIVTAGIQKIEDLIITIIIAVSFYVLMIYVLHRESKIIWSSIRYIGHLEDTTIALLLSFVLIIAWASVKVNLSLVVGAYIVGLAFSEIRGVEHVIHRFSLIPNIFASLFFVLSAAMIDIKPYLIRLDYLGFIGVVLLAGFIGKVVGCGLFAKLSGFNKYESLFIGFGMLPRAEVALVITALGASYGVVTDSMIASIIILIYVTSIVTPIALANIWKKIKIKK
ncbi:MAG: cation:proton antiporter [Staphylothermus sp.]|nr:cation:proton antiporter [Staphylothermus sp.]